MSETSRLQAAPRVKILQHLMRIFFTAAVVATVFTIFTPLGLTGGYGSGIDDIFSPPSAQNPDVFLPTPTPRQKPKVGIVVGHWGEYNDVGAVCPDGLTELEVNLEIASRTQQILQAEGFDVDLFKGYDDRLTDYRAIALV
ncbi:MAG: N-acetylmuramoyl-L-alanine amidase, partial [Anaerolineales bacterium]